MKQLLILFTVFSLSPVVASAAPSYAAFEKACREQLEGHKKAKEVCACMSRNFAIKKLDDRQVRLLTELYRGVEHGAVDNGENNALFEFEEDVAMLCLKNQRAVIKP
ncbi:MAG: hypothetical protein KF802_01960 [Bdellovibrionaceae bacterium]|nr:hypothetical protein [Pseudobdellovibrionaceae bacterium]MBX3033918.1 hypothetical protein [Pseudobdellovibrionaceae bacterium]